MAALTDQRQIFGPFRAKAGVCDVVKIEPKMSRQTELAHRPAMPRAARVPIGPDGLPMRA